MKRIILAATIVALIAIPAAAEPYRDFTDVRTRAAVGTTVIRDFPNARTPSFRLLLERQGSTAESGAECVVWIEFTQRAGTINHFGGYGKLSMTNRRALVEGPLSLHLVSADVGLNSAGACVAGARTLFTSHLAYRDVVDGKL
jgi:hypothetical protein